MQLNVPTLAQLQAQGKSPEILFWVGCAGSIDERAKRITRAFANILQRASISFAILGTEEQCSGDPAKRAGNEFLFQMQALQNIATLNAYQVTKIVTACPHCFNTLKNEYPDLGGHFVVIHHTQFMKTLLDEERIKVVGGFFKGKRITYHDPCYLGRANHVYEAPREILEKLDADLVELKSCKSKGLCCGAGGAQMFKESESGTKEINIARTEEIETVQPDVVAAACPFCNTMLTDGIKAKGKQQNITVLDIAEVIDKELDQKA